MLPDDQLTSALNRAAALAEGSKWNRLLHQPFRYLCAIAFRHLFYTLFKQPWKRKCRTFFGTEMTVDLPAGMDLFLLGCKTHDSELRLARFFIRFIQPGDNIADVGAHFGYFSLLAAHLAGPEGSVWSFEPGSATHTVLTQNTQAFQQMEVHRLLVGAENSLRDFWEFPTLFSEYNTTRPDSVPEHLRGRKTQLASTRLDTFFTAHQAAPRLIKIDVEGAEYEVVQGLEGLFEQGIFPVLAMEYLGEQGHQQAVKWLLMRGYQVFVPASTGELHACKNWETWLQYKDIDSENFVLVR
jgi:FkbM family methyltransferase